MKKILFSFLVIILAVGFFVPNFSSAQINTTSTPAENKIEYVLFHLETCPHCKDEIKFINKEIMPKYGEFIDLKMYEVSTQENQKIFEQYGYFYKVKTGSVPVAFIDGQVVQGYASDKTTGVEIMRIVEEKLQKKGLIQLEEKKDVCSLPNNTCVSVPVLGRVDAKTISLPILTVVVGLLDGFNPCAMWVLLFLISLLLGMKDKKRMWLLGSIFIMASGIVYFIFMAAWLQFLMFIGMILIIRILIGGLAVYMGGRSVWSFWKNRKADGVVCEVSGKEGTKKTFEKIKEIVHKKSLALSILGIIILGFSVNLVELACSAGFPAIYTQILSMSDLAVWQKYLYMLGYIVFYMLDDMVVFVLAMITLQSKVLGGKYAKYTNLVAGILIFTLGLLLILKPEWLMFT
ncbi:MAG: hypothetical protein WA057_06100 [Candidatus Magasanikiibacteriota bacterium]